MMVTVVTQTQAELPLQRAYLVTPDGKQTQLRQLNSRFGKIGPKTLTYSQLGQFRRMRATPSRVPRCAVTVKCVSTSPSTVSASFRSIC